MPATHPAGAEIIRRGEAGDNFYVIAEGEVEADDGTRTRRLGRGESFGEIALLRDIPRTATVRAVTPVHLYALERDIFIPAVTGSERSVEAADALIGARLGRRRGTLATM